MNGLCSHILMFCFSPTIVGGAVIRQSLSLLHLFKFFVVRQVCGPVGGFCLYSTCVWCGWKCPKRDPKCWEFPRPECWNCRWPTWWDFPCPVPKDTWVDLVDPYLLGMLGHSKYFLVHLNISFFIALNQQWT